MARRSGSKKLMSVYWDDLRQKYKKGTFHSGFKKTVESERKPNQFLIRCQWKLDSGNQCTLPASAGTMWCRGHRKASIKKPRSKIKAEKRREIADVLTDRETTLLQYELAKVNKVPEEELLDVRRDVKLSEAIIEKLLNQKLPTYKPGDYYGMKKIKDRKQALEVNEVVKSKAIKSLQYSIMNNASIKKQYFEIKFSDNNMVSKELYKYTVSMFNQIIIEEIKDIEIIERIGKRVRQLGLDIQSGNLRLK